MPVEKSAGAVIFRKEDNKTYYLLLHYPSSAKAAKGGSRSSASPPSADKYGRSPAELSLPPRDYWSFPKGRIEKGEKEIDAAKREVEEETGLRNIKFVEGFKLGIRYFFRFQGENVLKFVTFYLAETGTKGVKVSDEHLGFAWLPYQEAIERLKFKNAKEILKKADGFLKHN